MKKHLLAFCVAGALGAGLGGCVSVESPATIPVPDSLKVAPRHSGLAVDHVRVSAAGSFLDLRYRVTDVAEARQTLAAGKPKLIDLSRGAALTVPTMPKIGSLGQMRQTMKLDPDRSYFVMFANPDRRVGPGDRVALEWGGVRVGEIVVE